MAGWWFLGVSVVGATFTLNAYRPFRLAPAALPAFFAHWLTSELAVHHLVWQAAAAIAFVALGALATPAGWAGLAISLASWTGLAGLARRARGTREEIEHALREGLGDGYRDEIDTELVTYHDAPLSRYRLAVAFHAHERGVERHADIPYGPFGRRNRLDVWRHRETPEGAPVLLWIHGGAWAIGHKAQQALPMMNHLAARGWICVAPNYRLSPRSRFPDHLVDVKRALAWVRERGEEHGADPSFVMVSGGSAGGHLAALAALTPGDPRYQPEFEDADTAVQAAVPFYGVYDFTNRFPSRSRLFDHGLLRFLERTVMPAPYAADPDAYREASPIDRVRPDAPPFLVVHGDHDLLAPVAGARAFVEALRSVSREPVAYAELRGTQHAFELFHSVRVGHVIRGVERFGDWAWSHHHAHRTP